MRVRRRGDNIPPVSAYAHWNEDAYYMWYEENKYDMMHADEIIEDDFYEDRDDWEPDIEEITFDTEAEAREFMDTNGHDWGITFDSANLGRKGDGTWFVEYWNEPKRN